MKSICKTCGQSVTWTKTKEDKNVPMQRVRAYSLEWTRNNHDHEFARQYQAHAVELEQEIYISHFQLCPGGKLK